MIEGLLEWETGEFIDGDAPGYPRTIRDSSEWRPDKAARCERAATEFRDAAILAANNSLTLRKRNTSHYQLSSNDDGWLFNLYPSNGRIYGDRNRPRGTFLDLGGASWSLLAIVKAAIAKYENAGE